MRDKKLDVVELDDSPDYKFIGNEQYAYKFLGTDGKVYYYKDEGSWFTEMLCDKIATFYGIPVVTHKLASYNGYVGVISESLYEEGFNYIDGLTLVRDYLDKHPEVRDDYADIEDANTLEILWWAVEDRYKAYPNKEELVKKLMNQFLELYEFSLITIQSDMHLGNLKIAENGEDANVAPLYDNALSFVNSSLTKFSIDADDYLASSYYSVKKYFNYATTEQRERFIAKLQSLDIGTLNSMMDEITREVELSEFDLELIKIERREITRNFLLNKKEILKINNEYMKGRGI